MKIVALIEDGLGHRHLVASRSPDLVRRDLSAKTGTAVLLWCAVPPESAGAGSILAQAMDRLGSNGPEALSALPTDRILKVLMDLCITEPKRKAQSRRLQRLHPAIAWVNYPFLPSHPHYAIAKRQMTNGSGMVCFGIRSGYDGALRMLDKLQFIARGVSLGDANSLIVHQATLNGAGTDDAQDGVGDEMVRLSVGLEDVGDIIADLRQALAGE